VQIQSHISLRPYHTFGIEVSSRYLAEVHTPDDLKTVFQTPWVKELPYLVLGKGSNVLFTKDFEGLVVINSIDDIELIEENKDSVLIKVGAGVGWHSLVLYCVGKNWGGLENLALIPGTMGAAPVQNIGAYGVEVKDCLEYIDAIEIASGKTERLYKADCKFGYRDSIFKKELKGKMAISYVYMRLSKNPVANTSSWAMQAVFSKIPKFLPINSSICASNSLISWLFRKNIGSNWLRVG
jgi:UDP-N-acetylmuramate dehydrogenase